MLWESVGVINKREKCTALNDIKSNYGNCCLPCF